MEIPDKIQDQIERLKIQSSWKERLSKINTSMSGLCDITGIAPSIMSRLFNLKYHAGWKTIKRVEEGFSKFNEMENRPERYRRTDKEISEHRK